MVEKREADLFRLGNPFTRNGRNVKEEKSSP